MIALHQSTWALPPYMGIWNRDDLLGPGSGRLYIKGYQLPYDYDTRKLSHLVSGP